MCEEVAYSPSVMSEYVPDDLSHTPTRSVHMAATATASSSTPYGIGVGSANITPTTAGAFEHLARPQPMHAYGFGFDLEQYEADDAPEPSSTATSASTSISTSTSASMSGTLAAYVHDDDERTPVVSDQPPIPPSSFPTPGTAGKPANGVLQSPFRGETAQYYSAEQVQAMSMSHAPAYDYSQQHQQPLAHPHTLPAQYYYQPQYVDPNGFSSAVPQYVYPAYANPHDYARVSPTSSSHSLTRSGSTSSAVRPKVKLTHEDKRRIVELHRTNSSLRQEDIAKQYGVDRSTISKIILAAHRWISPAEPIEPPQPRAPKVVGGRFPAVEEKMHEWMDRQIAQGNDVRDQVARDQAKAFAAQMGFAQDRFKASAKWLDKFKDRRKATGRPTTSMQIGYFYPYNEQNAWQAQAQESGEQAPADGSLVRTQSSLTMSSESSFGTSTQFSPAIVPTERLAMATRSETDLGAPAHSHGHGHNHNHGAYIAPTSDVTPTRQRSQSSPQIEGGMLSPSSGKVHKPSALALQRQNSYHGSISSPRRPNLSRANTGTSTGSVSRKARPGSLAASAFGITPLGGDDAYSPISPTASSSVPSRNGSISQHSNSHSHSHSHSYSHSHSRARSDASSLALTPFTTQMGVLNISPDVETPDTGSSSVSSQMPAQLAVPPLTPNTPLNGQSGGVPMVSPDFAPDAEQYQYRAGAMPTYGTMPNKHYAPHQYAYLPADTAIPAGLVAAPAGPAQYAQAPQHPQYANDPHAHAHAHAHAHTHSMYVSPQPLVHAQATASPYPHSAHAAHVPIQQAHALVQAQAQVMTDFGPPAPGQYQQWS